MEGQLESQQQEESKTTVWSLVREFCSATTAHGLGKLGAATNFTRAIFWSLLFIGAVTMLSIQVYCLFAKYATHPLSTRLSVETDTSLPFPVVTICNFNPIKSSTLAASNLHDLKNNFNNFENTNKNMSIDKDHEPKIPRKHGPSDSSTDTHEDSHLDNDDVSSDDDPEHREKNFLEKEKMFARLSREDETVLSPLGHRFEDMVLSCTLRGISCRNNAEQFWDSYWHYNYGNCYVFNMGIKITGSSAEKDVMKSYKPGPAHGLIMEINIEQDEYLGTLTQEAGARVVISNQGEMPFPVESGVSLAPGYATMIGLRKRQIRREDPFENKSCLSTSTFNSESNLYTRLYNVSYSTMACRESCLANTQLDTCGCVDYRFPTEDYSICDVSNKTTVRCLNIVQRKFKLNELNCAQTCPPPCREDKFLLTYSFATWPSKQFQGYHRASYSKLNLTTPERVRENVLKLQVFYQEFDVDVITEQMSYDFTDFLSDLGGHMGLWIGFSVLTVAEFVELILLMGHVMLKKRPKSGNEVRSLST